MFRYIALAWSPGDAEAAALGRSYAERLHAATVWQAALQHPSLNVFLAGAVEGINQAYLMHAQRGAVVGRLFDRENPHASTTQIARLLSSTEDIAQSDGKALTARYWGRYVAFFQASDGRPYVVRDPSGALPCFRLHHRGVTIVFSWLDDVLERLPQLPAPAVAQAGLAAFMAFGDLSGRHTALEGVTQVLAGERVALDSRCRDEGELLWNASEVAAKPLALGAHAAVSTLRETVMACTRAWASCYDPILLRLSGGVDSSILAACMATGRVPSRVSCLNYHSVGARSDERGFARLASEQSGRELLECERLSAFPLQRVLGVARTPTPQHYIGRITSAMDAEVARSMGASAMFTGIGGDQLFFERRQWWPAADYLRLRGLDAGFATAVLDAARLGKLSVWRTLRLAFADRWRTCTPPLERPTPFALITDHVRQQAEQPAAFLHPDFTSTSELPIGKLMQVQQMAFFAGYYDPIAREHAPELVNPLLSQPLIELCLRLPTYLLTLGGRGRGLVRVAFEGDIPDAIAHRRSKGSMEEHTEALLNANTDFVRQLLLDGELVRLGMIDRQATEAALSRRAEPPGWALVAELHLCVATEAWLQRCVKQRWQAA